VPSAFCTDVSARALLGFRLGRPEKGRPSRFGVDVRGEGATKGRFALQGPAGCCGGPAASAAGRPGIRVALSLHGVAAGRRTTLAGALTLARTLTLIAGLRLIVLGLGLPR
jgi:hypothetical protein